MQKDLSSSLSSEFSSMDGLTVKNTFLDHPSPWQENDIDLRPKASSDPLPSSCSVTTDSNYGTEEGQAREARSPSVASDVGGPPDYTDGQPVRAEDMPKNRGARVRRREEDWKWGDQDGGPGSIGVLREVRHDALTPGWVHVAWNSGNDDDYRAGAKGKFDLQYVVVGGPAPGAASRGAAGSGAARETRKKSDSKRGEGAASSGAPADEASPAQGRLARAGRDGAAQDRPAKSAATRLPGSPGPLRERYGRITRCARRRLGRNKGKHRRWLNRQLELAAQGQLTEAELARVQEDMRKLAEAEAAEAAESAEEDGQDEQPEIFTKISL